MIAESDSQLIEMLQAYAAGSDRMQPAIVAWLEARGDKRAAKLRHAYPLTIIVARIMCEQVKRLAPQISIFYQEWLPIIEEALGTGKTPGIYLESETTNLDLAISQALRQREEWLHSLFPEFERQIR